MAMKGYSAFPQSSSITEALPSDCLVSYPEHWFEGKSYSFTEMQSVYSKAPANLTTYPSGATTPDQSGPVSDGNKGLLRIPQSSSITEALPSDCLVSYPEHWFEGKSYSFAEI